MRRAIVVSLACAALLLPRFAGAQEGKLHFERASVPSTGGVISAALGAELAPAIGAGTGWTCGTGWDCSVAGALNKNADGVGTAAPNPAITAVVGTTYKVVITVGAVTVASGATYTLGGTAGPVSLTAAATYTHYVMATTTGSLIITPTPTGTRFTITEVSVKALTPGTGGLEVMGDLTVRQRVLVGGGTTAAPPIAPINEPTTGLRFTPGGFVTYYGAGSASFSAYGSAINPAVSDGRTLGDSAALWQSLALSRSIQGSKAKSLTDAAAAVSFTRIAVPTNGYIGGELIYTANSTDGTNRLTTTGRYNFAGADTAGTVTCGTPNAVGTPATAYRRANTLVCAVTAVTSTTNCDLQVTCTDNLAGTQTVTFEYRLDMPSPATVSPQ